MSYFSSSFDHAFNDSQFNRYHDIMYWNVPLSLIDLKAPFVYQSYYPKGAFPLDYDGGAYVVVNANE